MRYGDRENYQFTIMTIYVLIQDYPGSPKLAISGTFAIDHGRSRKTTGNGYAWDSHGIASKYPWDSLYGIHGIASRIALRIELVTLKGVAMG